MLCIETLFFYLNNLPQSDSNRNIVKHMLKNIRNIQGMTIYDLANACYASPATISRLLKKMKFKTYTHFQKSLSDSIESYMYHNRFLPLDEMFEDKDSMILVLDEIQNMITRFREHYKSEDFSKIAEILHESKYVVIYCGVSMLADTLQSDLFMSGIPCEIITERGDLESIPEIDEHCTVLFFQPKRMETSQIEEAYHYIKSKGAKIIAITNTRLFPVIKQADIWMTFKGKLHIIDSFPYQLFIIAIDIQYRAMYLDR